MIRVKNHHMPATIRVEMALGAGNINLMRIFIMNGDSLWGYITSLLHQRSNCEPHGVAQRKLVDKHLGFIIAGVRIVPLIRTKSVEKIYEEVFFILLN